MNCRQFEINAADWVKGRTLNEVASQMAIHSAACAACSKVEASERTFLAAWQAIPMPRDAGELWPKVAARLDRQAPARHFGFGRLAFGGTLAAGALCALMFFKLNPTQGPAPVQVNPPPSANVITMVAEMRQLPDPDQEIASLGLHSRSSLILGGQE